MSIPSGPPSRPATLKDIAKGAGVDVSTVSKVLNEGGKINVRPETRQRIVDVADRLRYRPHAIARSLKTQRTGALGMLLPDFTNPVYATIVRGAVRRAQELGYVMLLAELQSGTSAPAYTRLVSEHRIDGLMIATAAAMDEMVASLAADPVPHVFVNRRVPEAGRSVTVDDEQAGRMAARCLIDAGHRRLGFIGDSDEIDTARRRRAGFAGATEEAGRPPIMDATGPYSRRGGYEACLRLIEAPTPPTGIFASNLLVGIGALAALHGASLRVPQDVSIVTLDAQDAAFTVPAMTAISMPLDEMGARAAEELHSVILGREPHDVVVDVPPVLVERESVAPPRATR